MFTGTDDVLALMKRLLPNSLRYDQFGRAEITLEISGSGEESVGWSGVKSMEEVSSMPGVTIERRMRMPGGLEDTVDSIEGAWYPEMVRNSAGRFEVAKDEAGNVKNPKGKFEPKANIATLPREKYQEASKTNKLTVNIQRDNKTFRPTVLTIFPGDNAPAFPAKINTESYKSDTLSNSPEAMYWQKHVFIQVDKA